MAAQNVYDHQGFFQGYSQLPRSQQGLDGAPEWPELRNMVGDVTGLRILDLGCGYGWFCRWASSSGASKIHGIDISEKMISRAREFGDDPKITYTIADLGSVELDEGAFEVVYSSLAFHYLPDVRTLFAAVRKSLVRGGRFVFSIEHPIFTAPIQTKGKFVDDVDSLGHENWLLNSYADEGQRIRNWLGDDVKKEHRKMESYVSALLEAGFVLTSLKEWMPSVKLIEENPDWKNERERPMFLLIAAQAAPGV